MKAILQNMSSGELEIQEVPAPALRPKGVLVAVRRSLISTGTERSVIHLARKGLAGKAKDRPDLVRKVFNKARQEGLWKTYQAVRNRLDSPIPLGYSCSGEVLEVGREAPGFQVGQRVACAGQSHANHAEVNYIPRNLAVPVPEDVSHDSACFVTLGAIAMQGVRLAEIQLGEKVVVLGLGLVGQIAAQLARASGAMVLASDLDPRRMELASQLGAQRMNPAGEDLAAAVTSFTGGYGADAVLVCAATRSSEVVRQAVEISRLKGRVVVVGDVGLELERRPLFDKEVKVVVSRSYGPGRYDPAYETHGIDYPLPYVRWTEGRNMSSFLELVARGDIQVEPLVTHRFSIEKASGAYDLVSGERKEHALAILLDYPGQAPESPRISLPTNTAGRRGLRFGVIGAGQFARGVLLPAFARHRSVRLRAFCTSSGLTSRHAGKRYGAAYCTGDASQILEDPEIDAIIIATRHDQHARLTEQAFRHDKAVFVEKPLALSEPSLARLCSTIEAQPSVPLMVGFNRRFSPLANRCREFFAERSEPLFACYRVNAGKLPPDTWITDPVQGGGRIIGEVCHFVDMLLFLSGALPVRVYAETLASTSRHQAQDSSVTVTLTLSDGSVGVIHYLTQGAPSVAKEYLEVFSGERTAILDNYRSLTLHRGNRRQVKRLFNQAKGHAEEVAAFVNALERGSAMPIDLETLIAVTQTTFLIHRSLETGQPVSFRPPSTRSEEQGDEA